MITIVILSILIPIVFILGIFVGGKIVNTKYYIEEDGAVTRN